MVLGQLTIINSLAELSRLVICFIPTLRHKLRQILKLYYSVILVELPLFFVLSNLEPVVRERLCDGEFQVLSI